jgi:putative tryptophan/tyrosine transport system substrate-binding protein
MKKSIVFICILLIFSVSFSYAIGKKEKEIEKEEEVESNVIGISKIVAHPALDAVENGIMDQLKELGYEFEYDLQNANGDINAAASIATKFNSDKVRVAIGIATPTAQALVNTIDDIPIVFSAVTDPVGAGLVSNVDMGEGNVTGVSDLTPVKAQIEFLLKVKNVKRLGHVYSSHEANAVALAEIAEQACKDLGIEFVGTTVTNSAEVKQAVQIIIDRVDAIYVSTDNTVVSALSALVEVATDNNVPVMSADPSSAETIGVIAAWGFDYYKMGRATGAMVAEILEGKNPEEIPVRFMTDPSDVDLLINLDVAEALGLTFPDEIIENANKIVKDGELTTK